jgi:hypothetical protein
VIPESLDLLNPDGSVLLNEQRLRQRDPDIVHDEILALEVPLIDELGLANRLAVLHQSPE